MLVVALLNCSLCEANFSTENSQYFQDACGSSQNSLESLDLCCKNRELDARQGDKLAQYEYGNCVRLGMVEDQATKHSYLWYLKSAKQDFAPAFIELSNLFRVNRLSAKNTLSRQLLEKAIQLGSKQAKIELAGLDLFSQDNASQKLTKKSLDILFDASIDKNARALMMLGKLHLRNSYIASDYEKAYDLLEKAAKQNEVVAMVALGLMVESGRFDKKKDIQLAEEWYRRACQYTWYKNPYPMSKLGRLLAIYNDGVDLDKVLFGIKLLLVAAHNEYEDAQLLLIRFYEQGIGVQKNLEQRDYWKQRLAQNQQQSGEMHAKVVQEIGLK